MRHLSVLVLVFLVTVQCTKQTKPVSEMAAVEIGEVTQQITFLGRIRSEKTSLVRAPIDAQLVKLHKSLGAVVKAGEDIAIIEQPKDENRLTGVIQEKGRMAQLEVRRNQINVRLDSSDKEIKRLERLLSSGSIASTEYESAQVAHQLIVKELESISAEEKTITETLNVKSVTNKNATRTLQAVSGGTIVQLWTSEDNITPGMTIAKDTIIATIEEPGQYVLKGEVVEADFIRMRIGQPVAITLVHGGSKDVLKGSIKSISPMARQDQFGVGRFDVTANFAAAQNNLRTGLEAKGIIVLHKKDKVRRLPRSAVRQFGQEYRVSFPGEKGPMSKVVTVGLVGDQFIELTGGAEPNEQVYQSYVESHN